METNFNKGNGTQKYNNEYEDLQINLSHKNIQDISHLSDVSLPLGDITFINNNLLDDIIDLGTFEDVGINYMMIDRYMNIKILIA